MLTSLDADPSVHVMVITGNEKAFAAGADIAAMAEWDYAKVYNDNYITRHWEAAKPAQTVDCGGLGLRAGRWLWSSR